MLQILILSSFLNQQFQQQEFQSSYILPKESQFLKGEFTNLDEKILKHKFLGLDYANTQNECDKQFIVSLENSQKKFIYVLYLKIYQFEYQLKIYSDFFNFQDEIWLNNSFEGVWIFFDSIFDYNKRITIFYLYKSLAQELTEYKIDQIPIFQDQIHYQIGEACDLCVIQNFVNCFTRFEGRLSILFQIDDYDNSSNLTNIEQTYTLVNDCVEKNQKLVIGSQIFNKNFYSIINLGILEKLYFQLTGWVKVFENLNNQEPMSFIILIYKNFKENYPNSELILQVNYQDYAIINYTAIAVMGYSDSRFSQNEQLISGDVKKVNSSMMKQWHFIQLDVGQPNQNATFKIFSNQMDEIITFNFLLRQSTGIYYGIEIGGDQILGTKMNITINNLEFKTFCQPLVQDQEFTIICHQTCQTCFGPFYDNCLSCRSSSRRFLQNDQCICDPNSIQFQVDKKCQTINDLFNNLMIVEEELTCKQEVYDQCNDSVICSFGYFKYLESYCIQCPYVTEMQFDSRILCVNCLLDPEQFSNSLTCNVDVFQINQEKQSTFDAVQRNQENLECFEIKQLQNKQYQLQLIENKISNNPPFCRKGYFYENEICNQCGQDCIECISSIMCSKCEEGYYLDKQNICAKCQNCLKCELQKEQLNCLSCPQKFYQKNEQCFECGQFCADCKSNSYCNYCIDSQKYFISIDGINCLICNIPNCKYCYQQYKIENQIFYTSFNLDLENQIQKLQSMDNTIYCAKCQEGYILDLNTNTCIKQLNLDNVCLFGFYDESKSEIQCQSDIIGINECQYRIKNCNLCFLDKCIECQKGYYIDFLAFRCSKCPVQCENCIFQNKRLRDSWRIEILARYDKIDLKQKFDILSSIKEDYEIECTSCPLNYILYNSNCILGCNDECLKCEIIGGSAKCVECKPYNNKTIRSIGSNRQCLRCLENCELCGERSQQSLSQINKFFIQNQENRIYTRSCYKPSSSKKGITNFLNSIIDCEKFNKCKRKIIFPWNIYCDIQQFQNIQNKGGDFQEGNYYFNDFFEQDIFSQLEIITMLINEKVIEQIDITLNIFQGNINSCKLSELQANLIKIHNKFLQNIFLLQRINLKVIGQQQNVLLEELIFEISGFQQIQFENLNFTRNQINIKDTLINSISFINCSFENNSPIQTLIPYNLNLRNVTIQITNTIQNVFLKFVFGTDDLETQNVSIIIDGLRIINSKLQNTNFISIISDIGQKVACYINNLEIIETEFDNSFLLASSTSSGLKNIFFGNFTVTGLKIENLSLKNSILFYIPNVHLLKINFLTIKNLKLQSNSYFILSNQLNCSNFQLNQAEIDKSYLFSNKIPFSYQTIFGDFLDIFLNNITIKNVIYNQEQSLLQIIKFGNFKVIVNLNYFRIDQINQADFQQNFFSQDISLIYITCTQCYLNQIDINRSYGIPEFSIVDSEFIIISNSFFTQNQKQAKNLFNGCQTNVLNALPKFIYIGQYNKVKIYNLTIYDAIGFNYPFIMFKGIDIMQKQIYEYIEIFDSKFENNKLITSESNSPTSVIKIYTEQKCFINLTNLTFSDNHLNMEIQDLITKSSATLLIDVQLGKIQINYCLFHQNIVTNSTDSTLYFKAQSIEIINSRFIKNNVLNYKNLYDRVQFRNQENSINDQHLKQLIKVLSNGGSGYLLTNTLSFQNCSVEESYSLFGGAFYIYTFGDAQIQIDNSTFLKTSTSFESSVSSNGGCFYIDAQVSKLTLLVSNSTFNQSYGRSKGGCFYILPSNSYNFVYFEQIKVINSFSTTSQFFDLSLQNLQNIISNVTFYNIQIIYNRIEFYQFLSLLDGLSNNEVSTILNNDPIIMVQYGNVTMDNIYCQFEIKNYLALIDQGQIIKISQIYIENGFLRNSPLFSLNLISGFQGQLTLQNIKISNLLEYQDLNDSNICQIIKIQNKIEQLCISPVFQKKNIALENKIETIQQITLCKNLNLIFKSEKLEFSLIEISNIDTNHNIIFQDMFLSDIFCKNCQNGLLSFTNIDEYNQNNIILNGIMIQKCSCGIKGCLSIINKKSHDFLKTNYIKKEGRILQVQNYESLKFALNFQVSLSNSKFIQNIADYGGAIFVVDIDILINLCYFFKNKAKVGGAIYSFTSLQQNFRTVLFTSIMTDNQAELAADIYLENQMFLQAEKVNLIIENNSTIKGSNIFERPRSLAISTNNGSVVLQKEILISTSTQIVEQTIIKPYQFIGFKENIETLMFPSGQSIKDYYYFDISTSTNIPYNLSFRIIALNMLNQKEDQLDGSICTLKHKVINKTNQHEIEDQYAKLSNNKITYNTSTLDFNLDELIVYFNPYYDKEIIFRLFIQCDMIQIPVYDEKPPFLITNFITDYQLLVDIKTFPCQLGEYFNSTSKICIRCNSDQSQYQVQQNATICSIKDETRIKSVESEKIELKPTFWRAYFYSTKIEECYHLLENCLGGWYPGDKSCAFGHIGALCEQCDLYDVRGDGHFSTSSPYQCSNCDLIEWNIITIFLISLWTLVSVLLSVNSTIDTMNQFIIKSKLKLILFGISSLSKQSSTAVLIKVFTNYIQIISTVSTFQLKVPAGLTQIFTSVGNPIEQVAYSLDCFIISISDISIIYLRIIWSFLLAISYIITFFLLLAISKLTKQIKFNIAMITTALIYIFIFLQPNIIQQLISLVSYRILSNIAWIQGNVAYRYDSTSHQYWMMTFCLPILISLSLLIPFFMFYCIHSNRHHLEQIKIRETWGYLYNEYKLKAYYWEFIKIFQKELIIIFLAYYEDFIAIKASLVFLVIFAYSLQSNSVQPYMSGELNRIDTQSTTVSAISIILGSSIYTAQNQNFIEIVYPFYIIIALINGWFLFKMIIHIFLAYFEKFHEQIDKMKEIISKKFPQFLQKHPYAKKLLESKRSKLGRIQSRFSMIKQYLIPQAQKIIKFKNEIQFEKNSNFSFSKVDENILSNDIIK